MSETKFSELNLIPEIKRAVDEMGFDAATSIQAQAIPLIMEGGDVIGKSQTGTGKTVAFGIPALSVINRAEERPTVQVLIMCPTRELACQACEEIRKLSRYMPGIHAVEVYGGAPMDRQILRLKKANIVVGTPGRIMDHMRRRTLKINNIKMVVLDEADEMLSMGFKEDIETILTDTPAQRQTVLFSATMPKAILNITKEFQKEPKLIEIDASHVTLDNISQYYIDAPMGTKQDTLNLLLHYHNPQLAMIFCNTKRMVDEVTAYLDKNGFFVEGLHGDMKQSQRTKVMDSFKLGKTKLLVATDVAARGIDVSGIDYVINYDIPQNNEYYVHRIGRTGRAGNSGIAITICSGRKQIFEMRDIARSVKSEISELEIPTISSIKEKNIGAQADEVKKAIDGGVPESYLKLADAILAENDPRTAVAAALFLHFGEAESTLVEVQRRPKSNKAADRNADFSQIVITIGRAGRAAPNHIVGALTERAAQCNIPLSGSEIGKIDIYDDKTIVGVPKKLVKAVSEAMDGIRICGQEVNCFAAEVKSDDDRGSYGHRPNGHKSNGHKPNGYKSGGYKSGGKGSESSDSRRKPSGHGPNSHGPSGHKSNDGHKYGSRRSDYAGKAENRGGYGKDSD